MSNQEFSILVTAMPADDVRGNYNDNINESRRRFINFSTNVQVNYYPLDRASSSFSSSCSTKKVLFGSDDRLRDFRCPYDQVALDDGKPSSLSWHVISEALSLMDLPFPLEDYNTQLNWAAAAYAEAEEEEIPLRNKDDLVWHIAKFARSLQNRRKINNNLGLRLLIEKRVFLPQDEFEAMEAVRRARQRTGRTSPSKMGV